MKKFLLGLAVILISTAPCLVSAQGFPGLPSIGGMFGRSTGYCGEKSCDPGPSLALEVGYTGDRRGATVDITTDTGFGIAFPNWRYNYPLQGLWLGLTANIPVGDRLSFTASGSWLVPSNQRADEEQIFYTGIQPTFVRKWATSIQWYTLGAGAALSLEGPVSVVGGFRYESFETKFHDPEAIFFVNNSPTDEAEVQVNLYLPYVGLVMGLGSGSSASCGSCEIWDPKVQVGLIGFPYTPGEIKYAETIIELEPRFSVSGPVSNGFFMEAFLNCNCGIGVSGANVGFFAKWSYVHAKAGATADAEDTAIVNPENRADSADLTFDRRNWTIGAIFDVNFVSPL
jgi:hypothetical protein